VDLDRLQHIAFSVANETALDVALRRTVEGLTAEEGVVLARIWMIRPGDTCSTCLMRPECPNQEACLHLVASDGASVQDGVAKWTRLDGAYRRFPLEVGRKVGRIGVTGEPLLLVDIDPAAQWLREPEWALREGVSNFAGQPLVFRGETLGVLAIFSRDRLTSADMSALRTFADHAAASLANARAFEEIARLKNQLELVATTEASVLIQGETGTGKELIARRIHQQSGRSQQPLITVNCASIPHELFESEFFGHVKGSFTGAIKDRCGRFELADKGTLFLDEVGEIPLELQSKLLRTLQEGSFERIGDERSRQTDVRLITATNRNLEKECEAGRFRQDLYYRLGVFPIAVPSLRERSEDIPLLADKFLESACKRLGYPPLALKQKHVNQLQAYHWPGNIRELQNVIERAAIVSQGNVLQFYLPFPAAAAAVSRSTDRAEDEPSPAVKTYVDLKDLERNMIIEALKAANGKVTGKGGAAERLGANPSTLTSRMASMGIKRNKSASFEA
jgi:transcriptional regulator with GAF, ATPase, and Fis domain